MVALGSLPREPYHWGVAGTEQGETLVDAVGPGYRQIANLLRGRILSGTYPPGVAIPGQKLLAEQLHADVAVVNRAVGILGQEGLVRLAGHGRHTIVLEQRRWRAAVTVRWASGEPVPAAAVSDAAAACAGVERDPAIEGVLTTAGVAPPEFDEMGGGVALTVQVVVLASDVDLAVVKAWALVREALRADGGWDLDKPLVTATQGRP